MKTIVAILAVVAIVGGLLVRDYEVNKLRYNNGYEQYITFAPNGRVYTIWRKAAIATPVPFNPFFK